MGVLKRLFGLEQIAENIENAPDYAADSKIQALELEGIAIQTAIGYIASAVSQCEFRTYLDGDEVRKSEYYRWNYSPNSNQNASQFIWDLVETLIYDGEALIVQERNQLFLADTFTTAENGVSEKFYQNISVDGQDLKGRTAKDVLHLVFDNNDVRPLLSSVCNEYEALIETAASGYSKNYADKGILSHDGNERGKHGDNETKNELLRDRFKTFFSAENAVLPLAGGYTYTPLSKNARNTSEINDVKILTDEIYNRVGQAFRIPPTLLRGEIGDVDASTKNFLRYAVKPICFLLEREITRKLYGEDALLKGSYLTIDTSRLEVTGAFDMAEKVDKLIACGLFSIDEARRKIGEPAVNLPETQKHFITKNYAEIQQKGENEDE